MSTGGTPDELLLVEIRADLTSFRNDLSQARQEMDRIRNGGRDAGRDLGHNFDEMKKKARELLTELAGLAAIIEGFKKLVEVNREFAVLNASLITATGSAEGAATAFTALQQFAQKTPYDLKQAVEGFTQLVNLGLTPSERAMTSYGNTASAMGKDLKQMIEAVADAATGEFERLKEFGIKAKNNGDTIAFTFRGTTETVKNNAKEIEEYLIKLGENNFAGAMAQRMATLDGAISNLGDTVDQLFLSFGKAGATNAVTEMVTGITNAVQELSDEVNSGQLGALFDGLSASFHGWGDDMVRGVPVIVDFIKEEILGLGTANQDVVNFMISAFKEWPENVRAFVRVIATEMAYLVQKAEVIGHAIKANLDPTDGEWVSYKQLRKEIDALDQTRMDSIQTILSERDASAKAAEQKVKDSKRLREEYDKERKARTEAAGDVLAQFGVGKDGAGTTTKKAKKEKEIGIDAHPGVDPNNMEKWMQADIDRQLKQQEEAEKFLNGIRESHMTELELLDKNHEDKAAKLQEYRDMDLISEQAYNEAQQTMAEDYTAKRRTILEQQYADEIKMINMTNLAKASQVAAGFNQMIGTAGQHNRKLFEIQKAARIAEAALSIPATVISAYRTGSELGGPILGASFAAVAFAAQMVQLRQLQSASFGSSSSGGGATGGSSASTSTGADQAPSAKPQSRYVNVTLADDGGGMYSKTSVRKLIERIGEEVKDGAVLGVN